MTHRRVKYQTPRGWATLARACFKVRHSHWHYPQNADGDAYAMLGEFIHNANVEGA